MHFIKNPVTSNTYKIISHSSKFSKDKEITGIWDMKDSIYYNPVTGKTYRIKKRITEYGKREQIIANASEESK